MTPAERDRLRALAEKAEQQSGGEPWSVVENGIHSILNDTDADFVAACSPAVVLSLLDALDASERRLGWLTASLMRPEVLRRFSAVVWEWDRAHPSGDILTPESVHAAIDAAMAGDAAHASPGAPRE